MRYHAFIPYLLMTVMLNAFPYTIIAQLPFYNTDFRLSRNIRTKGELGDSLRIMGIVDRTYRIQGANVIEYYEMNTARFLGFAGDTTQFDLRRLPYLSRTPMMRRLVREYGPVEAHQIRQGDFREGLLQKDILAIHGWPARKDRKGGKVQWFYDDVVLTFTGKVIIEVIRPGS